MSHGSFHAANKVSNKSVFELGFSPESTMLYLSPLVNEGRRKMKNISSERVGMISVVPSRERKTEMERRLRMLVWEFNI